MPQNRKTPNQSGNVFIIILLAVFLFGALMYAFSRSMQQGTGNITKQQSKIAAQEILNYARLVEGAVNRIRQNGCSENEISFNNAVVSGYSNLNAPVDESCHIFENEGGKISYAPPQNNWLDSGGSADPRYGEYVFTGEGSVDNLASTQSELLFITPHLRRDICLEINNNLDIDTISDEAPEDDTGMGTSTKFIGAFISSPPAAAIISDSGSSSSIGIRESACIYESANCLGAGSACYNFYHTLLAR